MLIRYIFFSARILIEAHFSYIFKKKIIYILCDGGFGFYFCRSFAFIKKIFLFKKAKSSYYYYTMHV